MCSTHEIPHFPNVCIVSHHSRDRYPYFSTLQTDMITLRSLYLDIWLLKECRKRKKKKKIRQWKDGIRTHDLLNWDECSNVVLQPRPMEDTLELIGEWIKSLFIFRSLVRISDSWSGFREILCRTAFLMNRAWKLLSGLGCLTGLTARL